MSRNRSSLARHVSMSFTRLAIVCAFVTTGCSETAPPRTLSDRELGNLTAFANALGYVRFFHPTEKAAGVNWDAFAIRAVRAVGSAPSDDSLAKALTAIFSPITSKVRFATTGTPLPTTIAKPADATHVLFWRHLSAGTASGGPSSVLPYHVYHSDRIVVPLAEVGHTVTVPRASGGTPVSPPPVPDPSHPLVVALGGGVSMSMPIALFTSDDFVNERWREASPGWVMERFSAKDRSTRLADVMLVWSLLTHFYPYFDAVDTDWPAALTAGLRSAATDADPDAFYITLQRLTAALHDGHARARRMSTEWQDHDVEFTLVEGRVLVTAIGDSASASHLKVGDEVLAVDDHAIGARLQELSTRESAATPARVRWRALNEALLTGDPHTRAMLRVSGADGTVRTVNVSRAPHVDVRLRPDSVAEVAPGVMYMDFARTTDAAFDRALPSLQHAKAVIFDMRGYPVLSAMHVFPHLSASVLHSPLMRLPVITLPNYQQVGFLDQSWTLAPEAPRVEGKLIFLSGPGAVSASETVLGLAEGNRVGDIVGEPSAGTNGIVNMIELPGGYIVNWTALLVQKPDGARHHGVGVVPTVLVTPTVAGIRAGRDEVLERAISLVVK